MIDQIVSHTRLFVGTVLILGLWAPAFGAGLKVQPLEVDTVRGAFHFQVEIADTEATRETGLMHRRRMASNRGMLFDFRTPGTVTFWMKDTLIPLDMIFIGADGRIVSITRRAQPMNETLIPSGGVILGVLELKGGRADEIGAAVGDIVRQRMFAH